MRLAEVIMAAVEVDRVEQAVMEVMEQLEMVVRQQAERLVRERAVQQEQQAERVAQAIPQMDQREVLQEAEAGEQGTMQLQMLLAMAQLEE